MNTELIEQFIKEDYERAIDDAYQEDYKRILFKWRNAETEKQRRKVFDEYVEIQHDEMKHTLNWSAALLKNWNNIPNR